MNLKLFYAGLSEPQKVEFAEKAGTTVRYIESHLIHRNRVPRKELIKGLSEASNGALNQNSLILWFHESA